MLCANGVLRPANRLVCICLNLHLGAFLDAGLVLCFKTGFAARLIIGFQPMAHPAQVGHPVGDKVLRIVARSLREGLKGRDTSARYGGEEFAIILPQTRLKDAAIVADQIRQGLAARKIVNRQTDEDYGTVTLSIGVAEYRYGEPLTDLIRRADDALYRAKRSGRNRVELESADVESIAS